MTKYQIPNMFGFWKWTEYWIPNIFGFWKLTEYEYRIVVFGPNYSNSSNSERIIQQIPVYEFSNDLSKQLSHHLLMIRLHHKLHRLLCLYSGDFCAKTLDAFPILVVLCVINLCKFIVISQHFLYQYQWKVEMWKWQFQAIYSTIRP